MANCKIKKIDDSFTRIIFDARVKINPSEIFDDFFQQVNIDLSRQYLGIIDVHSNPYWTDDKFIDQIVSRIIAIAVQHP